MNTVNASSLNHVGTRIDLGSQIDQGQMRQRQEDALWLPELPLQRVDYERGILLVVADGVGGLQAGDKASQLAVAVVRKTFESNWSQDIRYTLGQAVSAANAAVFRLNQDSDRGKMGTTIACCVVHDDRLFLAHVGDSRIYLLRRGDLIPLTSDHSWVQLQVDLGVLTKEEAAVHSKRHILTRSLGNNPTVEVELNERSLKDGDRLVLCTDGLFDLVGEDIIANQLAEPPQAASNLLVELANEAGGSDNIAVIAAVVSLDPGSPSRYEDRHDANDAVVDESTAAHETYDDEDTAERPKVSGHQSAVLDSVLKRDL